MSKILIKRLYEKANRTDGVRILIDRLWPRGIKKDVAKISFWAKSTAPSNELRKWYQHDHDKWEQFYKRYLAELDANPDGVAELREAIKKGTDKDAAITFVYSSKETKFNNPPTLYRISLQKESCPFFLG